MMGMTPTARRLRRAPGFSLVELLVAIAIFAILLVVGIPSLLDYLQSSQVRNAAESVIGAISTARIEAMKRNRVVVLQFNDLPRSSWTLVDPLDSAQVSSYDRIDGSKNVLVSVTPAGASMLTFDPLGRVVSNADGSAAISGVNLVSDLSDDATELAVQVRPGGAARMCVPAAPATAITSCS